MVSCLVPLMFVASTLVVSQEKEEGPKGIPEHYKLLYQQDFSRAESIRDLEFSDSKAWRIKETPTGNALELFGASKYQPRHRSPLNIALIAGKSFDDFILDVEAQSTVKPYNHQDLCFFFGFQSVDQFYYAHLAVKADPHAHNIMIVKDAPRLAIAKKTTDGIVWKEKGWNRIRIERKVAEGTIKVYFDDLTWPVMVAEDKSHASGAIGLGSFDDKGMFRNVKIWGPSVSPRAGKLFTSDQ